MKDRQKSLLMGIGLAGVAALMSVYFGYTALSYSLYLKSFDIYYDREENIEGTVDAIDLSSSPKTGRSLALYIDSKSGQKIVSVSSFIDSVEGLQVGDPVLIKTIPYVYTGGTHVIYVRSGESILVSQEEGRSAVLSQCRITIALAAVVSIVSGLFFFLLCLGLLQAARHGANGEGTVK